MWVFDVLRQGLDVILEIDWQGAKQIRTQFVETKSIFILPPSLEILEARLQKRHADNARIVKERMNEAKEQISHYKEFDYLVFNDKFEDALEDLKPIAPIAALALASECYPSSCYNSLFN